MAHIVTLFRLSFFAWCALAWTAPAHADACDEMAKQLASQVADLKVGNTAAGVIYLTHPAIKLGSLGCSSRNRQNDIYALTDKKNPSPEFYDFVASTSALVFSIPKPDALRGAQRCIGRIGILRGDKITTRYRKLDIDCGRSDTGTGVTISRERDK